MNARGRSLLTVRAFLLACAAFAWLPAYADVCPPGSPAGITNCIFVNNIQATQGLSCGGARSAAGCQAGEFVVAPQVTSNTILSCNNGDTITVDIVIGLYGGNANRYNVGAFFGEDNNDPAANTAFPAAKCSVATFPNTPAPWFEDTTNPNGCGDYGTVPDSSTNETLNDIVNIKLKCIGDANHNLIVPYLLTYDQNNSACTGPADVVNGTSSKCNKGSVIVGNVTVTPNADLSLVKSAVYDTVSNKINYTLTISNAGPDVADGATYSDQISPILTNVTPTCSDADATGGATCGPGPTAGAYDPMAGTLVSGTVGLLPVGGTVVVKISGDVAPGQQISVDNTACASPPSGTVDTNAANNCGTTNTQLPVTLQSFDVK